MKVQLTRRALADLAAIFEYIHRENPRAAQRVTTRLQQVIEQISEFPEMGQRADLEGIRRMPAGPYPYIVLYEVMHDVVVIHHIRHGARRPWRGDR
jgi:toxin ParE1/3/4